jgi:hypothetical protein
MQPRHQMTFARVRPVCAGLPDPNPRLLGIIRDWARSQGRDLPSYWEMSRPDERFARFCADAHQRAEHSPLDSRTRESYRALIADIRDQFQVFVGAGYTITPWRGDGQPYRGSRDMRADVRRNRHLFIYPTSGLSRDHPLARPAMPDWCWNDVFRAVHDIVGHAATGFQFGPIGEDNAFRFHATVQSAATLPALAAETRLQNCWVNFGPHLRNERGKLIRPGEPGYLPPSTRPYATQKAFSPVAGAIDCTLWRLSPTDSLFSTTVPVLRRNSLVSASF